MCEVTKENFEDLFPQIEKDIKDAKFVSIDTEFTGLVFTEDQKPSLFDAGEERYRKLKETISRITPLQIGVATFKRNRHENKYIVNAYNFALCPSSFGPIDVRFVCQASSLKFLCQHEFNFNKAIYNGIHFLNEEQETLLRGYLEGQNHIIGLQRDVDEAALQACCSEVAQWLTLAAEGNMVPIRTEGVDKHLAMTEIRERFAEVWAYMDNERLMIEKVKPEKKKEIMAQYREEEYKRVMNEMLGFSRVFRVLAANKKIIFGHNFLMDLMIIYDKFYRPLPGTFNKFKSAVHEIFPDIYDTKHIAYNFRDLYEDTNYFESKNLGELFKSVNNKEFIFRVLYSPDIHHASGFDRYDNTIHPHEAGYDAFMCGYVFLRMAHFGALYGAASSEIDVQTFNNHIKVMEPYKNRVNVIRGKIRHTCLDGRDPPRCRPDLLYVESRRGAHPFTSAQLARMFSPLGSVDVRMTGRRSALVAVSAFGRASTILFGGTCVWILWSGFRTSKS